MAWLLLLIGQPILATRRHLRAHRIVGWLGCLVMAGLLAAIVGLSHHMLQGTEGNDFLIQVYLDYLRLSAGLIITGCFVLAIVYRKNTPNHSRLMICTGLPLIDPVVQAWTRLVSWFGSLPLT